MRRNHCRVPAVAACLALAACAAPAPAPAPHPVAPARPVARVVARRPVPPGTLGRDLAAFGLAASGRPREAATELVLRAPNGAIRDKIVSP